MSIINAIKARFNNRHKSMWQLPSLSLLNKAVVSLPNAGDVQHSSNVIKQTLAEFDIEAEVTGINTGPKVTQYVLRIPTEVTAERVKKLEANIALNLQAASIRITESALGKSHVIIEVPNVKSANIPLAKILNSSQWRKSQSPLSFAVGEGVNEGLHVAELTKIGSLLFAGQTGSGKSVMDNVILTSLLFRNDPDALKLVLIDPKRVEMAPYQGIPHLLMPVVETSEQWTEVNRMLNEEIERRLTMFAEHKVDSIEAYNKASDEHLPRIVIVVDEIADIMMVDSKGFEGLINRLSREANNAGVHIVFATSRPGVDVITESISANSPTHWSFTTASKIDSMTVIGVDGAEKLLGQGDLLFREGPEKPLQRIQAAYVSDEEVARVADFWAAQSRKSRK